jgi:signal transduction histidine kinase
MEYEALENILDKDFITELPLGETRSYSGYYIQKVLHPRDASLQTLIIKSGGYDVDDIFRDILRFLALDLLILIPFWFLGRYFVREILKPVEQNMTAMSHFVHDAGHELKTPLAIISGNLQILRDTKEKDADLIDMSISTIHSMSDALDGLIELSNLKLPEKRENIALLEHTEEITKIYTKECKEKNITLSFEIPKSTKVSVESKHFALLMANLLKNAITYNKK